MNPQLLRLKQLDSVLTKLRRNPPPPAPKHGWLKAIREGLGITTRQLAARLNVPQPSVTKAEKNEASGAISLAQLRRYAAALGCEVHYVLVPKRPLAETVEQRAHAVARDQAAAAAHSMKLEAQETSSAFSESQLVALKKRLLEGRWSRLWG